MTGTRLAYGRRQHRSTHLAAAGRRCHCPGARPGCSWAPRTRNQTDRQTDQPAAGRAAAGLAPERQHCRVAPASGGARRRRRQSRCPVRSQAAAWSVSQRSPGARWLARETLGWLLFRGAFCAVTGAAPRPLSGVLIADGCSQERLSSCDRRASEVLQPMQQRSRKAAATQG